MSLSTQTVVSDGYLDELGVIIDYIDRTTIYVYYEGVETPSDTGLWNWVGTTNFIAFTPAVGAGVTLTVKRITDISEPVHKYSEGAQFRADVLDESFMQILHAAQEFQEITATPSNDDPMPVGSVSSPGVSNEFARADHVHVGASGGGTGTDGFSSGLVYAYQRSVSSPTESPGGVTYSFANHVITTPPTNDLANGWKKAIPAGDDPLWVTVATASNQNPTDTITSAEWASPVILAKDGVNGLNVATVYLYQRTPTDVAPISPTVDTAYNFTTGVASGMNNGWQTSPPPSFSGPYLWVNTATASSAGSTDTILAGEWSGGQILAQDGEDGASGGLDGLSNATFYAYRRSTELPVSNPGDVVYHFPSASITTPSGDALANGWTKTPPGGVDPLYVVVATASSSGTTDAVAAAEWSPPQILASSGLSVATVFGYQRTATNVAPPQPASTVTYNYATSVATGFDNGWTQTVPTTGGAYLWITQGTAAAPYGSPIDTIAPGEFATAKLLATNGTNGTNGSPGANGQRGTVTLAYQISGTAWSNSEANTAIAAAGYGAPQNRDQVTEYNAAGTFSQTRFYDSGTWLVAAAYIDGNLLVDGTVSAESISAGTFTGQYYRTDTSGARITLNEGGNNKLLVYNSSGTQIASLGGSPGAGLTVDGASGGIGGGPAIRGDQAGPFPGIYGTNTTGPGVSGTSASGTGGDFFSNTGIAVKAHSPNGQAMLVEGVINMYPQAESALKGIFTNNCSPALDNTYNCGTIAKRWMGITSATAVVVSSDARGKTEVQDSPLGLSFVESLRPVAYKLIDGKTEVGVNKRGQTIHTQVPGERRHFGLLAQEVRAALIEHGAEDAAFWILADKADPESRQALRYEELISPMLQAIKELSARVKALEAK